MCQGTPQKTGENLCKSKLLHNINEKEKKNIPAIHHIYN